MTTLITYCRRCDAEYEMDRADIAAGYKWWSLCPECRSADAREIPQNLTNPDSPDEFDPEAA